MAKTEETLIIEDVLYQNLFGSNPCLARELWVTFVIAACMIHVVCSFVFRMIRKDYYKKHPEEEPHYGTMYVSDLNKSKNDEGGDVDEKREND